MAGHRMKRRAGLGGPFPPYSQRAEITLSRGVGKAGSGEHSFMSAQGCPQAAGAPNEGDVRPCIRERAVRSSQKTFGPTCRVTTQIVRTLGFASRGGRTRPSLHAMGQRE